MSYLRGQGHCALIPKISDKAITPYCHVESHHVFTNYLELDDPEHNCCPWPRGCYCGGYLSPLRQSSFVWHLSINVCNCLFGSHTLLSKLLQTTFVPRKQSMKGGRLRNSFVCLFVCPCSKKLFTWIFWSFIKHLNRYLAYGYMILETRQGQFDSIIHLYLLKYWYMQ